MSGAGDGAGDLPGMTQPRLWPVGGPATEPLSIPEPIASLGTVNPGTDSGTNATASPRTASKIATDRLATAFHGRSFSTAIRAATKAIQPTLITPTTISAAISAQQQPTHQPPCSIPIRSAPVRPGFHAVSTNANGSRHFLRQMSF